MVEIVVSEQGKATDISIVSPLGFGLDERAEEAIRQWRFQPGTKGGKPVKILATIEVNFRFPGMAFDSRSEQRRTAFNIAVVNLKQQDKKRVERGVKSIKDLAGQKFPPAMYALGTLYENGDLVERDPAQALALISKAADKHYGPALYGLGSIYWEGKLAPRDPERALGLMRDAAVLGSPQAQYALGLRYQAGDGVDRDPERARRYFRLCAASGNADCQLRLGEMLLELPSDRSRIQAVAWLMLAAETLPAARKAVDEESAKLSPAQITSAQKLKAMLLHQQ